MGGEDPITSKRGAEGSGPRDAAAPSPGDTPLEASRSSHVVPSLNLAVVEEQRQAGHSRSKSQALDEVRAHRDSKVTNEEMRQREIESFKVKIKERRDKEEKHGKDGAASKDGKDEMDGKQWAYLTSSNLKEYAKAYGSSSSRQDAMRRVKQWAQQSKPPYESNPSPGIPVLMTSPHPRKNPFSLGDVTRWWQSCHCLRPKTQ